VEDQLDPSAKAKAQPAVPQILVLRGENGHAIIVLVKKLPTQIEGGVALRVETATTKEEFVALRESWEALTAPDKGGARTPFQSWGVTYHAWAMESAATSPLVLVARSGDEKVEGILALGVRRGRRGSFRWRDLRTIRYAKTPCSCVISTTSGFRASWRGSSMPWA
jgi:hypothetical protein